MLPADHHCPWREEAERLAKIIERQQEQIDQLARQLAVLQRQVFGRKSEKVVPPDRELRAKEDEEAKRKRKERAKRKRKDNAEQLSKLETEQERREVPKDQCMCPHCNQEATLMGKPRRTVQFQYRPGRLIRKEYLLETVVCPCGKHIVRAEGPPRVFDKGRYGPGFIAHLVVSKCLDAMPIHRIEKQFARLGIPLSRSTMNALFLRAGDELMVLYDRLLELVRLAWLVQADETTFKVQSVNKKGYVWTFVADSIVVYVFSLSRSGKTPARVLGSSQGALVVDAYTGYNNVTTPDGRQRGGCWSHARRYFFDALSTAPEAREMLDLILEIFRVEADALEAGCVGTARHHALRQDRSRTAIGKIEQWLADHKGQCLPKSPLGQAITYCDNQWKSLTLFLDDPRIPVHNNSSERALRLVAQGRDAYLFFGNEEAARKISALYTLAVTAAANGLNPAEYLTDVLMQVRRAPQSAFDDLLPHRWRPPSDTPAVDTS